jgi:hypothetical protein
MHFEVPHRVEARGTPYVLSESNDIYNDKLNMC